jgi:hypothetical protein
VAIWAAPEEAAVAGGAAATYAAEEAFQYLWALAASDATSCTAGNAPPKPQEKAPSRTKGPAKPVGDTHTATEAAPDLPDSVSSPDDAPGADTVGGAAQGQLDDACFSGAMQRADGSRTAGVWTCGDAAPDGLPAGSAAPDTGALVGAVTGGASRAGTPDEGGLYRRNTNTGDFAELSVPMQKRAVLDAAKRGGVSLDGVKVSINRQKELIGTNFFGHTPNGSRITLYPDAFRDMESLVKTIGHERTHIMQYRLYGPSADTVENNIREGAAYDIEDQFWEYYNAR